MTSEIDKLKHFHIEDYSGIYFTDELNVPLLGKLILLKNYVIGILLVLFDLLMTNGVK
jgi:hypothetical protein